MNYKLRIKDPSGAEFEAEGPAEFILAEKETFLKGLTGAKPVKISQPEQETAWDQLTEQHKGLTRIRAKHPGLKAEEAAILILAAEKQLKGAQETSALYLSKAIKASGFVPDRIDRLLNKATKEGLVKASGTKRNRVYRLTDRGLERASLEAHILNRQT